jgi:hypothetical protein
MKDVATALLAGLFILISLFSLISADPTPEGLWDLDNSQGRAAELEFRYALKR